MRIFAALILVVALNTGTEAQRLICFGIGVTFCKPIGEQRTTIAVCGRIAPWNSNYQQQLAAELRTASPIITAAVREAISLRDQARACATNEQR
jgi:hypothetical protein